MNNWNGKINSKSEKKFNWKKLINWSFNQAIDLKIKNIWTYNKIQNWLNDKNVNINKTIIIWNIIKNIIKYIIKK